MTPLHIQIMLHYYCRTDPYAQKEPEHAKSPAVKHYISQLLLADMLTPSNCENVFVVTEKGKAYIDALKAVKEPVGKTIWVQPEEL